MKRRIYPNVPEGSFLPGLPADGADVPDEIDEATATAWLDAGLATTKPPKAAPSIEPVAPAEDQAG